MINPNELEDQELITEIEEQHLLMLDAMFSRNMAGKDSFYRISVDNDKNALKYQEAEQTFRVLLNNLRERLA